MSDKPKIDDGGPAFPWSYMDRDSMGQEVTREQGEGMSLRDYFAAKAMQSIFNSLHLGIQPDDLLLACKDAYAIADAMLEARKEPK